MNRGALLVMIVPPVALGYLAWRYGPREITPLCLFGAVLAIFGFTLLTIARVQLGNSFSVTPQARALVTRGIYSRVRHPVYVFSAIGLAGLVLYFQLSPWLLLLLVPVAIIQVLRARAEERVLEQQFGEEYRQYRAKTWL